MVYDLLFSKITVGNLTLKNRIVFAPISTNLASVSGEVTEDFIYHYGRVAKGGAAIITVENACIDHPVTMEGATQPRLDKESFVPSLSRLTEEIHKYGALASIELTHPGLISKNPPHYAPSNVSLRKDNNPLHILNKKEIEDIAIIFAKAALIAKKSGFDIVEIEAAHGLLADQFFSLLTNKRVDEFGGSVENRTRFAKLIIDKIKELCGNDFTVTIRLGVVDFVNGGVVPEKDGIEIAKKLQEYGYAAIHADVGFGDKEKRLEPMAYKQAWRANYAKILKDNGITVPVIIVGVIREPEVAESLLEKGYGDIIAIGRTLVADPDWPNKSMYGKENIIRKCIGCSECIMSRHALGTAIRCGVNPNIGKNHFYETLLPPLKKKRIVVVGAGPAGLECARVLSLRGHDVVLFEKEKDIGGALQLASIPPGKEKINWLINYYKEILTQSNVDLRLSVNANAEIVMKENPDEVVLAIGSEPFIPKIPGINEPNVLLYKDVLLGNTPSDKKVVVGGGGLVGCETALYLTLHGNDTSIVEMLNDVALGMEPISRNYLLTELKEHNVKIYVKSEIKSLLENKAKFIRNGQEEEIDFDYFIIAFSVKPCQFEKLPVPTYIIGDALKPAKIVEAVRDGYALGVSL